MYSFYYAELEATQAQCALVDHERLKEKGKTHKRHHEILSRTQLVAATSQTHGSPTCPSKVIPRKQASATQPLTTLIIFNSLRHSAGHLAFGLQAQSRGCVKLAGVKGWFVEKVVHVEAG